MNLNIKAIILAALILWRVINGPLKVKAPRPTHPGEQGGHG